MRGRHSFGHRFDLQELLSIKQSDSVAHCGAIFSLVEGGGWAALVAELIIPPTVVSTHLHFPRCAIFSYHLGCEIMAELIIRSPLDTTH